ncbi:MAG: STAS domain-containing protein [Lachnospiraceae bacterium]|nr:STAS domain-containing protein [Lachnospiraceae bacterium]
MSAKIYELSEKLDTRNSKQVQDELNKLVDGDTDSLVMDFSKNTYISSAGIRVVLTMQKMLSKKGGELILKNVPGPVKEIFDVTGYSRFLNIQ